MMPAPANVAAGHDRAREYGERARRALAETIVPFWCRTIDEVRGGVFIGWNNAGTQLRSREKFTWSQGRFVWLWSRLGEWAARGDLAGRGGTSFLAQAERTVRFLEAHAFLPDGRCAFLLSEEGAVREAVAGGGPAPSLYADCFVAMGIAEYARVTGDTARLDMAWRLAAEIERRIAAGDAPTHPEPTPAGHEAHGLAMIRLNLGLVLAGASERLGDSRAALAREGSRAAAARIFERFLRADGRMVEMRPCDSDSDTLLSRHLNPGHALESLWMLLTVAHEHGRADWRDRAHAAIRWTLERGWDEGCGGLLHYADCDGGEPVGEPGDSTYEQAVRATWDTKLWWVHSEALYVTALCWWLTGDEAMREWFERLWEYSFRVFPHPDPRVGEWIQIRDRQGAPLERVVALPVKDPYHIARNLIQISELFSTPLRRLPR